MSRELDSYNQQVIDAFRANSGVVEPGLDLLLLHHVGARSGRERVTPLAYWRVDDTSVAVLASNRGAPRHPDWYHNLVANLHTKTEIGTETFLARARVAAQDERSKLLPRIAEETPSVSTALNRTTREIPLVILDLQTDDIRPAGSEQSTVEASTHIVP
jgi:deazaflavin-dependent oxidoreductase (nitroreductase family)